MKGEMSSDPKETHTPPMQELRESLSILELVLGVRFAPGQLQQSHSPHPTGES